MIADLEMLGAFMKDGIVSKIDGRFIVTKKINKLSVGMVRPRALRSPSSQTNSLVVWDIDLYSASIDDLDTVFFFCFKNMRELPKKTQYHVKDLALKA